MAHELDQIALATAKAKPCHCLALKDSDTAQAEKRQPTGGIVEESLLIPMARYADRSYRHWNKHARCWIAEHAKGCERNRAVMHVLRPIGPDGVRRWWNEPAKPAAIQPPLESVNAAQKTMFA